MLGVVSYIYVLFGVWVWCGILLHALKCGNDPIGLGDVRGKNPIGFEDVGVILLWPVVLLMVLYRVVTRYSLAHSQEAPLASRKVQYGTGHY